jgi:putrescine importer
MGRDNALPRRFFGAVSRKTSIPHYNVLLLGATTLAGSFVLSYDRGAELLNFGAFIAFMGVNLAALIHYKFRSKEKVPLPALIPLLGFLVCGSIWLNLTRSAQILGASWIAFGLLVYLLMRQRARKNPSGVTESSSFE